MGFGTKTRIIVWISVLLVGLIYLVVVDLGIHAGRIHRGVTVQGGVSVGGLTLNEAVEKLSAIGEDLEHQPLVFQAVGFDCRFTPDELGWTSRPFATARSAMRVGRDDAPFGALRDRLAAWFGGRSVPWADKPNTRKVGRFVQQCEKLGASFGVRVDKPELRFRVKRALVAWPRQQAHQIPLEDGQP